MTANNIGCATNGGGSHNFQPLNGETIFCTQCGIWANVVQPVADGHQDAV